MSPPTPTIRHYLLKITTIYLYLPCCTLVGVTLTISGLINLVRIDDLNRGPLSRVRHVPIDKSLRTPLQGPSAPEKETLTHVLTLTKLTERPVVVQFVIMPGSGSIGEGAKDFLEGNTRKVQPPNLIPPTRAAESLTGRRNKTPLNSSEIKMCALTFTPLKDYFGRLMK